MLKWTVNKSLDEAPLRTRRSRVQRRLTVTGGNKENLITSTPLTKNIRNASFSSPLRDILNITPEPLDVEPMPSSFATTLPTFEEEYSPHTVLPGQVLAMRGIYFDSFVENSKLLDETRLNVTQAPKSPRSHACKRIKLNETIGEAEAKPGELTTLDKLIDAILDSGRKDRKKGRKRSLNLRRRTLLRNIPSQTLSPSYTPGDDPASDLSFNDVKPIDNFNIDGDTLQHGRHKAIQNVKRTRQSCSYLEVGLALPSVYV